MICRRCGSNVADTERVCPICGEVFAPAQGARPQGARRPVRRAPKKGFFNGKYRVTYPQIMTFFIAILSLISFIAYLSYPFSVEFSKLLSSDADAGKTPVMISFARFFSSGTLTSVFYVIGAVFLMIACLFSLASVILPVLAHNENETYEIPVVQFVLHFYAFLTYVITASTFASKGIKGDDVKLEPTFAHILFLALSVIFFLYAVYATVKSIKKNGKFTFTLFGSHV